MSTRWKNRQQESMTSKKTTVENFKNIPLFSVVSSTDSYTDSSEKEPVIEGFDMFQDDYFKNVKRGFTVPASTDLGKKLRELWKQITDPVGYLDKAFEDSLFNTLKALAPIEPCPKPNEPAAKPSKDNETSFTWLRKNIVSEGFLNDSLNKMFLSEGLSEGFSMEKDTSLTTTIRSFAANHPDISVNIISQYYIEKLNKYQANLRAPVTKEQLFEFNNNFDNKLSDPATKSKLQKMTPFRSPYKNSDAGFQKFLKEKSRFRLKNTKSIEYLPFNPDYFPMPTDMKEYTKILDGILHSPYKISNKIETPENMITNVEKLVPLLQTTKQQTYPTPNESLYIYERRPILNTMPAYLQYVTNYYAFIAYNNEKPSIHYLQLLANVCNTYMNYANAVEFQKYITNGTFLTTQELAVFNQLFYIAMNQTDADSIFTRPYTSVDQLNTNAHVDLARQYMSALLPTFIREINQRMSVISPAPYSPISENIVTKVYPSTDLGPLLYVYVEGTKIPDVGANKYYTVPPDECKQQNDAANAALRNMAQTVKRELYRMFMFPVVMYIVYNYYYLFYFRDCYDDISEDTKECTNPFTPIFPDWESTFHSFEGHKTDYFLEFIFKPVKLIYTGLNAIKAIFRKKPTPLGQDSMHDSAPYIFFLITFVSVYGMFISQGGAIVSMLTSLLNLDVPTLKGVNSKTAAESIIYIFFGYSFYNHIGEWVLWLKDGMGFGTVIKGICFILYWLFKFLISRGMATFAVFITFVYIVWISVFGMSSYSNSGVFDKIDLIDRTIYTKLLDSEELKNNSTPVYLLKKVCFYVFYFMIEIALMGVMGSSMKEIGKTTSNSPAVNIESLKSIMHTFYILCFVLIALWCIYKYHSKIPKVYELYKTPKRQYKNTGETSYEKSSRNEVRNILMQSDTLNKQFMEEYDERITQKPSMMTNMISNMGRWGSKIESSLSKAADYIPKPGTMNITDTLKKAVQDASNAGQKGITEIKGFGSSLAQAVDPRKDRGILTSMKSSMTSAPGGISSSIGNYIRPAADRS
jgi:hypothetical protein